MMSCCLHLVIVVDHCLSSLMPQGYREMARDYIDEVASFSGMGGSPSLMYKGCVVKAVMLVLLAGCCQMVSNN